MRSNATWIPRLLLEASEELYPGYFALVMATGVISVMGRLLAVPIVPWALLALNWSAYAILCLLTLIRLVRFPARLIADLSHHQRAPGFFTIVAGTCVLGTQSVVVAETVPVAHVLWWVGLALWMVVMYAFFTAVTIRERKPSLAGGLNGAWLIAAVATQSIVALRANLDIGTEPADAIQFLCLAMFMVGSMLYVAIIPIIFYRLTFIPLATRDFSPPYWINMGAVAISTLAGALLLMRSEAWHVLTEFRPFIRGLTVFFWSVSTWWIPLLFALMVWRYLVRRDMISYEPQLWAMVFPLGMYAASTYELAQALNLPFLQPIPNVFFVVALIAWSGAFTGLTLRIARSFVLAREAAGRGVS